MQHTGPDQSIRSTCTVPHVSFRHAAERADADRQRPRVEHVRRMGSSRPIESTRHTTNRLESHAREARWQQHRARQQRRARHRVWWRLARARAHGGRPAAPRQRGGRAAVRAKQLPPRPRPEHRRQLRALPRRALFERGLHLLPLAFPCHLRLGRLRRRRLRPAIAGRLSSCCRRLRLLVRFRVAA